MPAAQMVLRVIRRMELGAYAAGWNTWRDVVVHARYAEVHARHAERTDRAQQQLGLRLMGRAVARMCVSQLFAAWGKWHAEVVRVQEGEAVRW